MGNSGVSADGGAERRDRMHPEIHRLATANTSVYLVSSRVPCVGLQTQGSDWNGAWLHQPRFGDGIAWHDRSNRQAVVSEEDDREEDAVGHPGYRGVTPAGWMRFR